VGGLSKCTVIPAKYVTNARGISALILLISVQYQKTNIIFLNTELMDIAKEVSRTSNQSTTFLQDMTSTLTIQR